MKKVFAEQLYKTRRKKRRNEYVSSRRGFESKRIFEKRTTRCLVSLWIEHMSNTRPTKKFNGDKEKNLFFLKTDNNGILNRRLDH